MSPQTLQITGRLLVTLGILCWLAAICSVAVVWESLFDSDKSESAATMMLIAPILGIVSMIVGAHLTQSGRR